MKNISLRMFYYKIKFFKQFYHNIVTIEKVAVRGMEWFALGNKESVINKRDDEDGNI